MVKIVVVFDFDRTIIDDDSDRWVIDELGVRDLFNDLLPTTSWNKLMDRMMKEIHAKGKTVEDIAECLRRAPMDPRIVSAIKSAHALGCDLRIVSDANFFFIETILKYHGLLDCFSEIYTNPSSVDEKGCLNISPFITSPHGCDLCPPNMCKGVVIERIKAEASEEASKRFIYLGDGKNDFCPSLKLTEKDYAMPRKNYPVWDLICSHQSLMKAAIHEWSSGEELERILLGLINTLIYDDNKDGDSFAITSGECKVQSIQISTHEFFPQDLQVPH